MGNFPEQTRDPYANRKRYFKTEKGKAALKRCQSSENGKRIKREWWERNRALKPSDRRQQFIDTYGDIETALKLLDKREKFVVIHLNGLDGNPPMTQEAVGEELFLTGSRIGQIYKDALNKLAPLKKEIVENTTPEK